jgi:light-regulated signal transduction histidine kinase (bacteriophytochrome)/CheY-like chemotaxis protein
MLTETAVDLTNCDREPIHIPGSIQPHGALLSCDVSAGRVLRHSVNASEMLGLPAEINNLDLADILGFTVAHSIRNALSRTQEGQRSALLFRQVLPSGRAFDISVHRFKGAAIVELEPASENFAEPLELARAMIGRITAIENIDRLVRDTARLVQAMLGYDRVMIYQFSHDGAGKVMSEARRPHLESFLGQYFPATDIPQQARILYLRNTIRIISDADFKPIPILPVLDPSGEPLDLSFAHLRSVSPIHCEYLRNMGVGASMSISIIVDGALWGLITCHHYSPRALNMAERVAAEMFGEFFSLHLNALHQKQTLDAATRARVLLDKLLHDASHTENVHDLLRNSLDGFTRLVPCDGVGIWMDGKWAAHGSTPPEAAIPSITRFAQTVAEGRVWGTHRLSASIPEAEDYASQAAGVLIIPLSQRPRDYLMFFRREIIQSLNWAGNPDKTYESGPLGDRLTPRKSFAIWKQTVHLQSNPWTDEERHLAEATRVAMVEVVLQHSELLADERSKADVRQRMLNEELNHRVKNILAVIKSLVSHPTHANDDLESYVSSLRGRIQALALAHDQVIRGDGGGALLDLLSAELTPYRNEGTTITLDGPNVTLDARAYSVMALVLHELSTNAAKYGALSRAGGALDVRWSLDGVGGFDLVWTESGGPKVRAPSRQGFGTVLIDRSVPFDLGGESTVDYIESGLVARFRIPPRFVSVSRDKPATTTSVKPSAGRLPAASLTGLRALVVEDQMLIAMDVEQILLDAGLEVIGIASSSAEALAVLGKMRPDVALLDINLGSTTSLPVANQLRAMGIPFLFATGYGDGESVPEAMRNVPIVRKPYEPDAILSRLQQLLA